MLNIITNVITHRCALYYLILFGGLWFKPTPLRIAAKTCHRPVPLQVDMPLPTSHPMYWLCSTAVAPHADHDLGHVHSLSASYVLPALARQLRWLEHRPGRLRVCSPFWCPVRAQQEPNQWMHRGVGQWISVFLSLSLPLSLKINQ